jgi:hypothetical protein
VFIAKAAVCLLSLPPGGYSQKNDIKFIGRPVSVCDPDPLIWRWLRNTVKLMRNILENSPSAPNTFTESQERRQVLEIKMKAPSKTN